MPPISFIANFIIEEYFFNRLQQHCDCDMSEICFCHMDYYDFLMWNIKCFEEFSHDKKLWIKGLCNDIKEDKVNIMDEETCVKFGSQQIFFDLNKSLIVTCPR